MMLENMNFDYVFKDRLPKENLEKLTQKVLSIAGGKAIKVAIYGRAIAGNKIFERFAKEESINVTASFDIRDEIVDEENKIYSANDIFKHTDFDLIINTTPPEYLFMVGDLIYSQYEKANILNLYSIEKYIYKGENWRHYYRIFQHDYELKSLLKEEYERLRVIVEKKIFEIMDDIEWEKSLSCEQILERLKKNNMCLGKYVDSRFESIARQETNRVESFVKLAEEFPFYVAARDAAATLLVQEGQYEKAVQVFEPALKMFPVCNLTQSKFSELLYLAGKKESSLQWLNKCLKRKPKSIFLNEIKGIIEDNSLKIKEKWDNRIIRPELKKRDFGFICAVPVWGDDVIELFMKFCLPSMLTEQNIPYLAKNREVKFLIYTFEKDVNTILKYQIMEDLKKIVDFEILTFESVLGDGSSSRCKYGFMSVCHNDVLKRGAIEKKAVFLGLADMYYTSQFFKRSFNALLDGYDTIFALGVKVIAHKFDEDLQAHFKSNLNKDISAKQLVTMSKKTIHPFSGDAMNRDLQAANPNYFIQEDSAGILMNSSFGNNPMFISPRDGFIQTEETLDVDLPYLLTDGGLGNYLFAEDLDGEGFAVVVPEELENDRYFSRKYDTDFEFFNLMVYTDPFLRFLGTRFVIYSADEDKDYTDAKTVRFLEETIRRVQK